MKTGDGTAIAGEIERFNDRQHFLKLARKARRARGLADGGDIVKECWAWCRFQGHSDTLAADSTVS